MDTRERARARPQEIEEVCAPKTIEFTQPVNTLEHEGHALALVRAQGDANEIVDDDRVRRTATCACALIRAFAVRHVGVVFAPVENKPFVPIRERRFQRRVLPPDHGRAIDVNDVLRGNGKLGRDRRLLKRHDARALASLAPKVEMNRRVPTRDTRGEGERTETRFAALRSREEWEHRRILHADVTVEKLTDVQVSLRRDLLGRRADGNDIVAVCVDERGLCVGHSGG